MHTHAPADRDVAQHGGDVGLPGARCYQLGLTRSHLRRQRSLWSCSAIVVSPPSGGILRREATTTVADSLAIRPSGERRTWMVIDERFQTVAPVKQWLEAHRYLWSPNTVRGYATSLAQWWTFLKQRGEAGQWSELGV